MANFEQNPISELPLSVIIPLVDHRDQAIACIQSWAQAQTYEREKFEVILVTNGLEPQLESQVKERLAPHDSLIYHPSSNEFLLYDVGARQAQGKLLFFTELHCLGEAECLAEMVQFLATHEEVMGGSCRSRGLSANLLAQMEERLYQEGMQIWSQKGHWRKIAVRGFAIYRHIYLAEGGFEYEYSLFAEQLFAAKLHRRGRQLGYAAKAIVRHYNTTSLADLSESVGEFIYGECHYRANSLADDCEPYFGRAQEWFEREAYRTTIARSLCWAILKSLPVNLWPGSPLSPVWAYLQSLLRFGLTALFGPRWRLLKARYGLRLARLGLWFWWFNLDRYYQAYRDYWEGKLVRYHRLDFITKHLATSAPTWPETYQYDLTYIEEERLVGFYPVEIWQGNTFRWSEPVALLQVSLPRESYQVTLQVLSIRPENLPLCLNIFFDNHQISTFSVDSTCGSISFQLATAMFAADNAPHHLVLVCNPLYPRKLGSTDHRALGLPIKAIFFSPKFQQNSQGLMKPEAVQ